jgi:hypothetical protein
MEFEQRDKKTDTQRDRETESLDRMFSQRDKHTDRPTFLV